MTIESPFVVTAKRSHGTVTYNCPTSEWALKKLHDFQTASYENISIVGPNGQQLTEDDLTAMTEADNAAAPKVNRTAADVTS